MGWWTWIALYYRDRLGEAVLANRQRNGYAADIQEWFDRKHPVAFDDMFDQPTVK